MSQVKTQSDDSGQIARANRAAFTAARVTALSLVGPAGAGKTSLIETLLEHLNPKSRIAVIVGGPAARRQVERIARHECRTTAVETENLAAIDVQQALGRLDLAELDLLVIESESNTRRLVELDLGQHRRAAVFSVAGGDDRATEHQRLIAQSDVVLLTKIDLMPLVTFDLKAFAGDVLRANPRLPIIQTSLQSNQGIGQWVQWVESGLSSVRGDRSRTRGAEPLIKTPSR